MDDELARAILAWGTGVYRQAYRGQAPGLNVTAREDDQRRVKLLEGCGFRLLQGAGVLVMERSLDELLPEPKLPDGFSIRPLQGEAEAPVVVALHRAAFGTDNKTLEGRLALMRMPEYEPALDLVAVAPDGTLAAFVFGSYSPEENVLSGRLIGYTDPVGAHPLYRRKGLVKALLLTCMRLLADRGMHAARLSTSQSNTPMQAAARSVGFRVQAQFERYFTR